MRSPTLRSARVLATLAILGGTLAVGAPGAEAAEASCSVASPFLTNFPVPGGPHFYYRTEGQTGFAWIDPGGETCAGERLVVDYDTPPIAPTTAADYTRQTGSVEWEFTVNHGAEQNQPIAVPLTQDATVESAAEGINAKLTKWTVTHAGGASHNSTVMGFPSQAPLYIVDDDGSTRVRFVEGAQSVAEDAGSVVIPMFRAGPTTGNVGYELVNGSASVATDLSGEATSGTFTFAPDFRMGTVTLDLNDDALCEGSEALTVKFPSGTVTDGPATSTLTITDDDTGCAGTHTLSVTKHGTGGGTVTSSPAGINCGLDCTENYTAGQAVTLTAAPAGGSVFDHWAGGCTGTSPTCNLTMNADTSVQAWFTASGTSHTLTVATNGTGTGTVTSSPAGISCPGDCSQDYPDGQAVTLTAAAGGGSTFANWSGACSGTSPTCNLTMNAAKSVTATFNTSGGGPFTLTVSKTGTGTVTSSPAGITCGRDCTQSYSSGTAVTLTAAPGSGWSFSQWSGDCSGTSPTCNVTMNSAKNVTATFVSGTTFPLTVTVNGAGSGSVTSSPAGINCPGDCTQSYSSGQAVTLTAAPGGGSTFAGWSGHCTGTSPTCNLTMSAARNVTATFDSGGGGGPFNLTVTRFGQGAAQGTVTSSPAGIDCGVNCSEAYPSGQAVTLTATAGTGWNFDHWEGDCSGTSPTCNLTMGSDKAVAAWFEDHTKPTSDFHHPKQALTYDYDDDSGLLIREVHNFPSDAGSGMDAADGAGVEIALRRKRTDESCEWWNGSGFTPGGCAQKVWHDMTEYDVDAFLYHFPEMTSSVGTAIRNYTAYSRATDEAGNVESAFIVNKNINTFEIAPNSP